MKRSKFLAFGAASLALSACSSLPSATTLADGTAAVYVSTLNEAPVPKPETQRLAEQQCSGSATYVATENVTPIKARHIYRCGSAAAGYAPYGYATPAPAAGNTATGYSDNGITSSNLAPL